MNISEALVRYILEEIEQGGRSDKTARNYRSAINSFVACCGDLPVELISVDHIVRWNMYREQRGTQLSTINHDLSRFKQILKYLKRRGLKVLDRDAFDLPKLPKGKRRPYLLANEVQKIVDVIESPRDKAIFACLFDSGCRISELLNINRTDIKADGSCEIIGKGDVSGTVYFSEWSLGYLNQYLDIRRDNLKPLFVSGQCRRITVSRVQQLSHIYADKAGMETADRIVTPHTYRHSFGTDLKLNGADIFDIKEQLRHEKLSSTEIYVHIENEKKHADYKKFHSKMGESV